MFLRSLLEMLTFSKVFNIIFLNLLLQSSCLKRDDDEGRPYEFGFVIEGEQHRHEKKDVNGIIQGEFGFITADGVYHVTAYATDENGNFRILSMRNIRLSEQPNLQRVQTGQNPPNGPKSAKLQEAPPQTVAVASTEQPKLKFSLQPTVKPACAGCGYVTTPKPIPGQRQTLPPLPKLPKFAKQNAVTQSPEREPLESFSPVSSSVTQSSPEFSDIELNIPQQSPQNYPNAPGPVQSLVPPQNYPINNRNQIANEEKQQYELINPKGPNELPYMPSGKITQLREDVNNNIAALEEKVANLKGGRLQAGSLSPNPGSKLSQVTVSNGAIHVPGNPDIPIKDKYPGMQDGLPPGIEEADIKDILYKFNYTVGFHGHYEQGLRNGAKIGGYFVNGRDGISRIVTYVADENGYRPKVKFVRLGLESDKTPKEETEKNFGLINFEFVWYPIS